MLVPNGTPKLELQVHFTSEFYNKEVCRRSIVIPTSRCERVRLQPEDACK